MAGKLPKTHFMQNTPGINLLQVTRCSRLVNSMAKNLIGTKPSNVNTLIIPNTVDNAENNHNRYYNKN